SIVDRPIPCSELTRDPPTRYGISRRSNTSRRRLSASARLFICFRIPTVGTNHQFTAEIAGSGAQQHLVIASAGILPAYPCFGKAESKVAEVQGLDQLLSGRHLAQHIQPYFHRTRIGIGVRLRMLHSAHDSALVPPGNARVE